MQNNTTKIFRETKQRNAIKHAIDRAGRPVGPKEILEIAADEVPNLGIATVYRNIKTMLAQNEIVRICGVGIADCYATSDVADICADSLHNPLYQVGDSLYLNEPQGFVLDCSYRVLRGHIGRTDA